MKDTFIPIILFSQLNTRSIITKFVSVVSNVFEFLNSEDQICLLDTGWFLLERIPASLHDFLLVIVKLNTLVDDTTDPVDVEGDLGVPAGNTPSTANAARHDADESGSVLVVSVVSLQGAPTVTLTGPTECSLLVLPTLGTEHSVAQTVGKMFCACLPH